MNHQSNGAYRILESPGVYERFQKLLGAHAARKRFVAEFLRPFSGARLLDMGCGTGSLLDYLPEDVEYHGFDMNPAYISSARLRYGDRGSFSSASVGDGGESFAEASFDFVVAKSILHHLSDDEAAELLGRASRCLRAGGTFVSSDPVRHDSQPMLARLVISLDRGRAVRSPEAYRRLVEACFEDVEARLVTDMLIIPYSHFIMRASRGSR